jgi:uncharacterized RDD family membrane protein YckC
VDEPWAVTVRRDAPTVAPPRLAPIVVEGTWIRVDVAEPWRRVVATLLDAAPFLALGVWVAYLVQGSRVGSAVWPGLFTKNIDTRSLGLPDVSATQPLQTDQLVGVLTFAAALLSVYALWAAYRIVVTARTGQTLGKRLLGIAVVDAADPRRNPSVVQCVRRFLVPQGAGLVPLPFTGWAPYVWILRDPQRRGLHDKAAGTLVVKRPR